MTGVGTLSCQGLELAAGTPSVREGESIVDESAIAGLAHGDIEFLAADEGTNEAPGTLERQMMTGMNSDVGFKGVADLVAEDNSV